MAAVSILRASLCAALAAGKLEVPVAADGSYQVVANGEVWFKSAPTALHHSGRWYSSKDHGLKLTSADTTWRASESAADATLLTWEAGPEGLPFETSVRVFDDYAVFTQSFPSGVSNTSTGHADGIISSFPTLVPVWKSAKGVLAYQGDMTGSGARVGSWAVETPEGDDFDACRIVTTHFKLAPSVAGYDAYVPNAEGENEMQASHHCNSSDSWAYRGPLDRKACAAKCRELHCSCFDVRSGSLEPNGAPIGVGIGGSGPVAIFSRSLGSTLVISAFSNFMAHSQTFDGKTLAYGIMGNVTEVPKGYTISTIISLNVGINSAMDHWGSILLNEYKKERYAYKRDLAVQTLGYSTDNGAYYYYQTEKGKNYEDTLIDVKRYADSVGIPYRYILLDSWWYFKGEGQAVTNWEPLPEIFPNGLENLYKKTSWPQMLHNRYWGTDNVYAKQNGGKYTFVCPKSGGRVCVPDDQSFWDDLIANHTATGMFMYEQDWLDVEFDWSQEILSSATLGATWMKQMDAGIARANATLQMCMSHVRHCLQSVQMPSMTNARASGDYHPGNKQWDVGTTSILAHALGFAPTKDNYWSTAVQVDTHYGNHTKEPHSELQAAVSTMSAGPVAPSDKIGASNVSLIMRACDASGRLLSPDRPATEIDSHFVRSAFGEGGPDGHLWATSATVEGRKYVYVMAIDLKSDYELSSKELGVTGKHAVVDASGSYICTVDDQIPLRIQKCGKSDFRFFMLAPMSQEGHSLLGEPSKWISVSSQRFSGLSANEVVLHGKSDEEVTVSWLDPRDGSIVLAKCKLPYSGQMQAGVRDGKAVCLESTELVI